ncbi:unnamed protein product [Euphydryas editha]|uniref:Breast cancer type 1 susceptibility protein n=1 Tax=Euphydryas editha TaxID=104508 RepID=A0AAU9VEF4_EUPED|nr:unnamed protein product [Euphydryas editha]
MIFNNLDVNTLSRLASHQVDHVTCIECCKYYVVPTTATCGHSLCHTCWRVRRTCPFCGVQVEKKSLKLNVPLQSLKEHVQLLASAFEEIFKIKLDEFSLETANDKESEDSNKNVKEWLASSQNHFSAPITESQQSVHSVEHVTSNIQIHSIKKNNPVPVEVVHVAPLQVDWDKIEEMPNTENVNKNEENLIGPMDIEPFDVMDDDKDYSTEMPRRSSRNKENKGNQLNKVLADLSSDKNSGNSLNMDKSKKPGKNWNNVKRMKKEFSKLNKKNKNKLNVSIEMCKKTQSTVNKAVELNLQKTLYDIDDSTPEVNDDQKITERSNCESHVEEMMDNVNVGGSEKDANVSKNHQKTSIIPKDVPTQNCVNNDINVLNEHHINTEMNVCNVNTENLKTGKVCFFKKSPLNKICTLKEDLNEKNILSNENSNANCIINSDDIEITIKIGNTLTNICIKKKDNDVQLKINSDREIQTNVENINVNCNTEKATMCSVITEKQSQNTDIIVNMQKEEVNDNAIVKSVTPKTLILEKKHTASAETATGNFEITESVERELSDILDNAQLINEQNKKISTNSESKNKSQIKSRQQTQKTLLDIPEDMEYNLNDLDIFDSESVKERNVQSLKTSKNTPSAILMPSMKSNKNLSLKDKREREVTQVEELPKNKKIKLTHNSTNNENLMDDLNAKKNVLEQDSENINYDAIMSQVFANIDADMGNTKKTIEQGHATDNENCNNSGLIGPNKDLNVTQGSTGDNKDDNKQSTNEKYSENIFSVLEKDSEILELSKSKIATQNQHDKENSINTIKTSNTNNLEGEKNKSYSQINDIEIIELGTPLHDDDSDKSIVEETPQKSTSFSKNKKELISNTQQLLSKSNKNPIKQLHQEQKNSDKDTEDPINVLSLSDTLSESTKASKNITVVETVHKRPTLETPLTINKFVDQIKHKSTPMARKSLNFNSQMEDDPEQTLCPSSFVAAKTTQEKEFMHKAFDQSQSSTQHSYTGKNRQKAVKLCVGGSCLSSSELANLRLLCIQRNWTYLDKYSKELTHLVVGVDEENKSQRSVKYMCALAASKWIVSYKWVEKCLQTKDYVDEEPFEALDGTGEPGPRRSRIAKQKIFEGITFYCMPPFSVLDSDTLQDMVRAAGGRAVREAREARAGAAPALLLAEPERTQDDKFTYLTMELGVVPVNYEWVLNCLGGYTLGSIYELLLCPASLLPPITSKWPPELISRDYE